MNLAPTPRCAYLIDIARQLIAHLPQDDLRAAFLFGSAAWGDADASSDLDIMLLVDRPAGYREVTRIRLADFFGSSLPGGPIFADLDRISIETFLSHIQAGDWAQRVVHSNVLIDTQNFYTHLRAQVSQAFLHPSAREGRFLARQEQAKDSRAAALHALHSDALLSALHARLALQHAGAALIELSGNRVTPSHFVDSLQQALATLDDRLFALCLAALSLDAPSNAVDRSLQAYEVFATTLKRWVKDSDIGKRLSQEDLAWARHTYEKQEEITYKVAAFTQVKRLPSLLYYLDGLFQVPIRIQFSKIFSLQAGNSAERMTIPDFQVALRQEPALYNEWIAALRLSAEQNQVLEVTNLAAQALSIGKAALDTL